MRTVLFGMMVVTLLLGNVLATPVTEHGALKSVGGKLVGTHGNPVQLAGNSLYWTLWGGQRFYNKNAVTQVATKWNASLIRAAIGVENADGYLELPDRHLNFAKIVVDAAIENDIYVIVDWHDHNANKHVSEAKKFFTDMAMLYKNTPNVIWEIWNEPDNKEGTGSGGYDSWEDIKAYADSIIPVIRQYSSNLIVVGTPRWSSDPLAAVKSPIDDPNVAYTLHFYAGTHNSSVRKSAAAAIDSGLTLMITEFGITDASGGRNDPTLYYDLGKTWLDWADSLGISWANWSLSNIAEAGSVLKITASPSGTWKESDISDAGIWIRDRLLSRSGGQTSDSVLVLADVMGSGTVTVAPNVPKVKKGTQVSFTAVPSAGWTFKSWSGASTSGENPLTLTIDATTSLVANFSPDASTNMLKNGDFTLGDAGWGWYVDTSANEASIVFDSGVVTALITKKDSVSWGIQISQKGLTIEKGATYTVEVEAWSTAERPVYIGLINDVSWYYQDGKTIEVSAERKTYTMKLFPDSNSTEGMLTINFGDALLPVYIDNVKMYKTAGASVTRSRTFHNRTITLNRVGERLYWSSPSKQTRVSLLDMSGRIIQQETQNNPVLLKKGSSGLYLFVARNGAQKQVYTIVR